MSSRIGVDSIPVPGGKLLATDGVVPTETDALFVGFGTSGVAYYRGLLPAKELRASIWVRDSDNLHPRLQLGRMDQPVVSYNMPRQDFMYDEVAELLGKGVKVIADVDDLLRGFVDKEDNHFKDKYTDEYVSKHEECILACDLVTCSTQFIADYYAGLGASTIVVPNGIDIPGERWEDISAPNVFNRDDRRRNRMYGDIGSNIYIAWSGSIGHTDAFKSIVDPLSQVLRENPHAKFVSMGMPMTEFLPEDLWDTQAAALPFVPFPDHPRMLSQAHINIGPSLPTDFYRAKSDLRCLEAWGAQQAFVGGVDTYGGTVNHGEDGLIASTADEWYEHLSTLCRTPFVRRRLAQRGRERLLQERTMGRMGTKWREAIEAVKA